MFVRTKTGIYDLEIKDNKDINYYQINDDFEEETYGGKTGRVLYIPSKTVLKKADTIDELCDEFVVKCNDKIMDIFSDYDDLKNSGWYRSDIEIYGAIWTSKGLIYVAKLNDEGKLVLI